MGGKGAGKTGVMVALAEWFEVNEIPVTLLDHHIENKLVAHSAFLQRHGDE